MPFEEGVLESIVVHKEPQKSKLARGNRPQKPTKKLVSRNRMGPRMKLALLIGGLTFGIFNVFLGYSWSQMNFPLDPPVDNLRGSAASSRALQVDPGMGEIPKIPVVQKPKVPTDPANPEYIFDVQDHAHDEEHELKQESKESVKVMGSRGPGGAAQEEEEGVDEAQRNMRKKEARKGLFALNAREKTDKLLTADDVFQSITSKESARVAHFESDPLKYRVCRFTKTCFNSTHTLIPVADQWERSWLINALATCSSGHPHPMCACFSTSRKHLVITPKEANGIKYHPGSHFIFDKYIAGKHIGHWTETAGLLHSILLHAEAYGMTNLRGIAFLKDQFPLTDHESAILELSTKSLSSSSSKPIDHLWADEINFNGGTCFEEAFASTLTARIATNTNDATALRYRAYDHMGFGLQECPPAKTVILHRSGEKRKRAILNEDELEQVLIKLGLVEIERKTISHVNSSMEQSLLFHESGLVISPHGSELVNVLFSQPKAALVEVIPAIFNYDFAQLGLDLATPIWFSVGGTVENVKASETVLRCNQLFKNCVGEPRCCKDKERKSPECGKASQYAEYSKEVKQLDFTADPKAFERVVKEMIKKLNEACGGHWPGVRRGF